MLLGELEKLILQYLWETEPADAKQVFAYFEKRRGGSLNTIQSTLNRLFKKGLLAREKQGHAFKYQSAVERDVFIGQLITNTLSDFGSSAENTLLETFSSLSNRMDDKQLDERRLKADSGTHEAVTKVDEVCRRLGISSTTFYNWRNKYADLEVNEVKRLRELKSENAKLKKLLAEKSLEIKALKDVVSKKWC